MFKHKDNLSNSPLKKYVIIYNYEKRTRICLGLDMNRHNYARYWDKFVEAVTLCEKKPGGDLFVDVTGLIDLSKWSFLHSKLKENLDLLRKVDAISLTETTISWIELEDLYTLYTTFDDKEQFPLLYIQDTPALDKLRDYRNFFQDVHRPLDFFDKLRVEKYKALEALDLEDEFQRTWEDPKEK